MNKILKRIVPSVVGLFIVAQLFRPELTNPISDPKLSLQNYKGIPPEVFTKMNHVCFDCHSNESRWPWYSYITPVNYLIAGDINDGRRHVNFSEWGNYKPGKLQSILDNIYDQVYNHEMPLKSYRWMHPEARLTEAEVKMICDWASSEEDRLVQEADMRAEMNNEGKANNDSTRTKK